MKNGLSDGSRNHRTDTLICFVVVTPTGANCQSLGDLFALTKDKRKVYKKKP